MISQNELEKIREEKLGDGIGDSTGLSWAFGIAPVVAELPVEIYNEDKILLRELAKKVAEIASRPEQDNKYKLWRRHNALEETSPLLCCEPESAWHEIFPAKTIVCKTPLARVWEFKLRREIYWATVIHDDRPILPRFAIQTVFHQTSRGLEPVLHGQALGHAYNWEAPVTSFDKLDELKPQKIIIDEEKTQELLSLAEEIFDGLLLVREEGVFWWSLGMTGDLIHLRGFEQMMMDMYDNPDFLHKMMTFLRDEVQQKLTYLEENGYLTANTDVDYVGTGGYGYTTELPVTGKGLKLRDIWGYCESQETVLISPAQFKEFIFPYQEDILKRFGLNVYGCCEPVEKRWDAVSKIERLRKVAVSPWSDVRLAAQQMGKAYVYVRKVNPAHMAVPHMLEDAARAELRETFEATKEYGCPVEVLMRDVVTLGGNPDNAANWVEIAREEAARVYG